MCSLGHVGLTLRACLLSSICGASSLSCRCLQDKRQEVSQNEAQGTLSLFKGGCKPQGLPVLLLLPSSSEQECIPAPIPPGDAAVLGMAAEAPGTSHHAHGVPITPQAGSLLTLAGCTGVSSATWGTGGWGTTRSIQPIMPLAAGTARALQLAGAQHGGAHCPGTPAAPAAHWAVS